ncbi:hypothetical protein HOLleu_21570 [Holothuria leucospilota]|uniref:Uncharacterized protein n=1 Tax=Holothuria leucospilota TaxID=206669 RepID=A0A9Q1BXZ6_HOLLE|nr:hypothetical protein HOLleu_21570 [Holothuria leucospilota]
MILLKAKISKPTIGGDRNFPNGGRAMPATPSSDNPLCRGGAWRERDLKEPYYPMPLQGIFCII